MAERFLPHATVATVIERNNRFLMVEEIIDGATRYNQPAGHLEANESLLEAAVRETREETAWHTQLTGFLGVCLFQAPNGVAYLRNTFVGKALSCNPDQPLDEGISRALWLNRAEVAQLGQRLRSPMIIASIDQYLRGDIYPLAMVSCQR